MASILSYKTKSLKHMHLCVHIYVENSRPMITAFSDYLLLALSFLCSKESCVFLICFWITRCVSLFSMSEMPVSSFFEYANHHFLF